jgi:hypothetical protein
LTVVVAHLLESTLLAAAVWAALLTLPRGMADIPT